MMRHRFLRGLLASIVTGGIQIIRAAEGNSALRADAMVPPADCVVVPALTNAVQFRLYTNASPTAPHLFNTFDIVANGQSWLRSPAGEPLKRWLAESKAGITLHNILVDGEGPALEPTNSMTVLEHASGQEWRYVALDVT